MHVRAVALSRRCSHMAAKPVCSAVTEVEASRIVTKMAIEIDEDRGKEIHMTASTSRVLVDRTASTAGDWINETTKCLLASSRTLAFHRT